jgi:ATP-binding protein involved in chromosome partitioning
LGAKNVQPTEDRGLIPPKVENLEYMSLIYYTGEKAAPLRGADTSNALIEVLAVTLWGNLDYLIIDTPPGIGDALLDLVRLVPRIEFLIVTTPSQLAFETVKKQALLLQELKIPIVGIVENMKMTSAKMVKQKTEELGIKFLAEIPYDSAIETAIGQSDALLATELGRKVLKIAQTV